MPDDGTAATQLALLAQVASRKTDLGEDDEFFPASLLGLTRTNARPVGQLEQTVSLEDWPSITDSTAAGTDNHDAIQAALNFAAGKGLPVILPAVMLLTSALTLPSGTRLITRGKGAGLKMVGQASSFLASGANARNVWLQGLLIDFACTAGANGPTSYGVVAQTGADGFFLVDCELTNTGTTDVQGFETRDNSKRIRVLRNVFSLGMSTAVRINRNPVGVRVEDNDFLDGSWSQNAIRMLGVSGSAASRVRLLRNVIEPHKQTGTGAVRQPIQINGVDDTPFNIVQVHQNSVRGPNFDYQDTTANQQGSADLISLQRCTNFSVIGNTVTDGGDVGITVSQQCARGVVSSNVCVNNDSAGICIGSSTSTSTDRVLVTGNTLVNNGQARFPGGTPDWARNGVNLQHATNCFVAGNMIGDDQTTKTQKYAVTVSNSTGCKIGDNGVMGFGIAAYFDNGGNTGCTIPATP